MDATWTVDDVAAYLRLHPQTVRRMAAAGRLPGAKIATGGRTAPWRFDPRAVRAILAGQGIPLPVTDAADVPDQV